MSWGLLFGLTLYFAWTSTNFIIGDNATFGTSTTAVTTTFVLTLLAVIIGLLSYQPLRHWAYTVFVRHQYWTAGLLISLTIIWQIIFVTAVHPVSGFDAGMLHYAAVNPQHVQEFAVRGYFSVNQNNLPIMLLMRQIVVVTGQTSWQFFDYLTLVLVDLSALFNLLTIAVLNRRTLGIGLYLHAAWLAVFPSILMPYTDAWVLPVVSLTLLIVAIVTHNQFPLLVRGGCTILLGPTLVATYFLKPSAIIPVIAMLVVAGLWWLSHNCRWHGPTLALSVMVLVLTVDGAWLSYRVTNQAVQHQTYIQIDRARAIPAIHFMAMGVYGEGGYSEKQAVAMAALPTKKQKTAYSRKKLVKRLKQLGPWGYAKFLFKKQRNNTADGTFGWLKEGHFFRDNQKPSQRGFANQIKNYIYLYGEHIADFRFIAQAWWIGLLTLIALGWGSKRPFDEILRLSLVGTFLFLLLFEGGRSRYLIQALPCFLILASLRTPRSWHHLVRFKDWFNGTRPSPANSN
nr:TIGR03766 family XrtG-associated glycosyltransferase [Lactiplantibacillus modestisalitolerans]